MYIGAIGGSSHTKTNVITSRKDKICNLERCKTKVYMFWDVPNSYDNRIHNFFEYNLSELESNVLTHRGTGCEK